MNPSEREILDALAAAAYTAVAVQLGNKTPFSDLPEDLKMHWRVAVLQTQIYTEYPKVAEPIAAGEYAARCAWEVSAGIIPGQPMPELTRRWGMVSGEYESEKGADIFTWRMGCAMNYLLTLQYPNGYNWATLDWIWY